MDRTLWNRIEELVAEARKLSGEERVAFLKERCADDGELLKEVMSLVEVDSKSGTLDSKPTISVFPVPQIVAGRFRIIRYIAEGGMGTVYEAEDLTLGDRVALKTIRPDVVTDPHAVERFKRETSLGKKVTHPNICRIYDLGVGRTDEGAEFLFLTMQFLSGETLASRIKRGPVPTKEALPLIEDMTAALTAAHQASVIHRDFKSSNVMLIKDADRVCAVVTDFGLARQLHDNVARSQTGMVGTVSYMAPEQIRAEKLTPATDVYALGVVMYEMVTGELPFKGDSNAVIALKQLNEEPKPPQELAPNLEPRWQEAILRCLRKLPEERFQSAEEVREALGGDAVFGSGAKRTARDTVATAHTREKWRKFGVIVVILLSALVVFRIWYLSKFHEKDTIVLADFNNRTGESGWDVTLKLALTNDLQDSQYLNVLPDQTVSETLKLMKRQPDEHLTQDLAKQVCLRNGNKALLAASITKVGERYYLDLRIINCTTGTTLASADADADSKEKVIAALKEASNELREKLGESLASVEKSGTLPLPPVTSASLDALQAYAMGLKMKAAQGSGAAVPFYKRAIELDPDFAEAYAALGAAYSDLGEDTLSMENSRKAYELRDHVSSQRERFHIEGDYYDYVTGEIDKANQTYMDWIQVYPDDHRPHQNLGANYLDVGQFNKGVEEEETVLELQPNNVNAFTGLMGDYLALNQPEKAKEIFEQARKRKLDHNFLGLYRYYTAFLQGDAGMMQQELEWAMGRPGAEDALLSAQSDTEAFYGQFDRARAFSQRAAQSAKNADEAETAAGWKANAALREAEVGNTVQARAIAADALEMSRGTIVELQVALALARAGESAQAEKITAKIDAEYPRGTMVQKYWLPNIRAAIELQRNNPNKALELLQETSPYELGHWYLGHLYPAYLRGEAYLMLGRGHEAAAEFQKLLDHRGVVVNFVIGSLARLQLARAAAMGGDTASARRYYEDFLKLWKDADTNLPVLNAARTEYERLP